MKTRDDLGDYVRAVTGERPSIREMSPAASRKAPLFLRSAYGLLATRLFGRDFALAVERQGGRGTVPSEYAKHSHALGSALGADVVLVLPSLPTHARNRLVRKGVPFVVPGRQMFMPFLAVDLRERDRRPVPLGREALSAAAQAVVLHHLLGRPMEDRPLGEVALVAGYSAMTMTNASKELSARGLCEIARKGRERRMFFAAAGRDLWGLALPRLSSPVRAVLWATSWEPGGDRRIAAGTTALDRYTLVSGDEMQTFAIRWREARALLGRGGIVPCDGPEEARLAIECWTYDPARLADGDCADRLSLFLSLRDSRDERIQKELAALLEGVPW